MFSISNNNIGVEAAGDIATVRSHNLSLQELYLNGNNLKETDLISICKSLQSISTLKVLNIASNKINEEAADDISALLSHNTSINELHLFCNNLQSTGIIKIASGLQNTSSLTILNISYTSLDDEAADDITAVVSMNKHLKELYLDGNNLQAKEIVKIARALEDIRVLSIGQLGIEKL